MPDFSFPSPQQLAAGFGAFQAMVKAAAPIIPGESVQEKAATLDALVDPIVDKWLQGHGSPDELVTFTNKLVDLTIQFELKTVSGG